MLSLLNRSTVDYSVFGRKALERDVTPSRVCGLNGYSGAGIHRIGVAGCDTIPKTEQISRWLVAWILPPDENQGQDKRVESASIPCLDTGSTPVSSTGY